MDVIAETPGEENYQKKEIIISFEIVDNDNHYIGEAPTLTQAVEMVNSTNGEIELRILKVTITKEEIIDATWINE